MTSLIPWDTMSIVVVVFACLGGLVASILIPVLRHARLRRELTHKERIKAAEVGQPMHEGDPTKLDKQFQVHCNGISFFLVVVPIVAVSVAAWITTTGQLQHLGYLLAVWCSVAAVSMTSVICATVVIRGSRCRRQ